MNKSPTRSSLLAQRDHRDARVELSHPRARTAERTQHVPNRAARQVIQQPAQETFGPPVFERVNDVHDHRLHRVAHPLHKPHPSG
jgi:hypothetical protein